MRSCDVLGKSFIRVGKKTSTASGSSLLKSPAISTASVMGPPRTVLRKYCNPSSPRSAARLETCSASSRRLQRLKRMESCSMAVCGSIFKTLVMPAAACRARKASSTNSGTRSSMPIFGRKLRPMPGRCASTPEINSSACSITGEAPAGGGFLAEPHECRAHKRLQVGVLLDAQAQAQMPQRFAEQLGIGLRVKLGHFGQTHGGFLARVEFFAVRARGVVLQNADGLRDVSGLDQMSHVGLHVFWRDAPCVVG